MKVRAKLEELKKAREGKKPPQRDGRDRDRERDRDRDYRVHTQYNYHVYRLIMKTYKLIFDRVIEIAIETEIGTDHVTIVTEIRLTETAIEIQIDTPESQETGILNM